MRLGGARGGLDLLVGGVGPAVGDVVPQRVGEQEALLEHHADLGAERGERDVAHVVAVDPHGPVLRVVEPREQQGDRRTCPTRTRRRARRVSPARIRRSKPSRTGSERQNPKCTSSKEISPVHWRQVVRAGRVDDRGRRVEQLEDPLGARAGLRRWR